MDIFEKVGEDLVEAGKCIAKKSKELVDSAKLHAAIVSEEAKIKEQYRLIGEVYYRIHRKDAEEAFAEEIQRINESNRKISEAREALSKSGEKAETEAEYEEVREEAAGEEADPAVREETEQGENAQEGAAGEENEP